MERTVLILNNEYNMANFICELRKEKQLTQKQLAEKLSITDKAVSKWERGLGYPDITILPLLAEILNVTTNELLNGKREETVTPKADIIIQNTLQYAEKIAVYKSKSTRSVAKFVLTTLFVLASVVCIICNLAISQNLTWSLYPIACIAFTWLILMPLFHFEKKAITMSLLSLSVFIIPFLYVLERIIDREKWLLQLGIPIAIVSIIYLWSVWAVFAKTKMNRYYACGIALIAAIPLIMIVNFIVSQFTSQPYFDIWDAMSIGIIVVVAIILFWVGKFRRKIPLQV